MTKAQYIGIALLCTFLVLGYVQYGLSPRDAAVPSVPFDLESVTLPNSGRGITVTPGVERWYTSEKLTFSFRLPDGYYAPDIDTKKKGVYGVQVYNDQESLLFVYAYPIGEGTALSPEGIRSNLPGVRVTNITPRVIGTVVTGYQFETDEAKWGGKGVGLWAAYNGYLYEIMTSSDDRELFDFITNNWFFAPPTPPNPSR